jgi:hypothetical protein
MHWTIGVPRTVELGDLHWNLLCSIILTLRLVPFWRLYLGMIFEGSHTNIRALSRRNFAEKKVHRPERGARRESLCHC